MSPDDADAPWSVKEREFAANREKQKGNEAFRANELEKAVKHYTASLELVPISAVVLANRYCTHTSLSLSPSLSQSLSCTAFVCTTKPNVECGVRVVHIMVTERS